MLSPEASLELERTLSTLGEFLEIRLTEVKSEMERMKAKKAKAHRPGREDLTTGEMEHFDKMVQKFWNDYTTVMRQFQVRINLDYFGSPVSGCQQDVRKVQQYHCWVLYKLSEDDRWSPKWFSIGNALSTNYGHYVTTGQKSFYFSSLEPQWSYKTKLARIIMATRIAWIQDRCNRGIPQADLYNSQHYWHGTHNPSLAIQLDPVHDRYRLQSSCFDLTELGQPALAHLPPIEELSVLLAQPAKWLVDFSIPVPVELHFLLIMSFMFYKSGLQMWDKVRKANARGVQLNDNDHLCNRFKDVPTKDLPPPPDNDCDICGFTFGPTYDENLETEPAVRVHCPAHHIFGKSCITTWLKDNDTCPKCRGNVLPKLKRRRYYGPLIGMFKECKLQRWEMLELDMSIDSFFMFPRERLHGESLRQILHRLVHARVESEKIVLELTQFLEPYYAAL
jgi:hypothetical protein